MPPVSVPYGPSKLEPMRTATAGMNQEANLSPKIETSLRAQHPIFHGTTAGAMSRFALDGIAVGDGWAVILAGMATEIEQHCTETGARLPEVLQVKEKLGALRVYLAEADDSMSAIIARAEERSAVTCEVCGAPGKLRTGSWLRTRCDAHADR